MSLILKTNAEILDQATEIARDFNQEHINYLLTYRYFVNYFKKIDTIDLDDIIIGISFSYSWMPTVLKKIDLTHGNNLIMIFNNIKQGHLVTRQELLQLKSALNDSLVGTSKLMHFINPEQYAIWDSRVYKFLTGKAAHHYKFKHLESYFEYLKLLESLTQEENFALFYTLMLEKIGYPVSTYRALELAFFIGGKKES